jgi:hypothetical protein
MPVSQSALSYADCYQFLDAAVADEKGARVWKGTHKAAAHFRFRCNYARKINRLDNARTYEKDHPMHGRSEYDRVYLTIRQDQNDEWWVYAEHMPDLSNFIEPLTEVE